MATPQRLLQKDSHYHIYNRGHHKQNIFLEWNDYTRFLKKLDEYQKAVGVKIICFCLMPNHFHLLLKQLADEQILKFMLRLSTSYSKYFNIKYEQVGSVFQDRFKAKTIDNEEYLIYLSAYIHLNPWGRTIDDIFNYNWSSLSMYLGNKTYDFCDPTEVLAFFNKTNSQKDYLEFITEQFRNKDFNNIPHLLID